WRYEAGCRGVSDRGRLERGAWGDRAVFDRDLNSTAAYGEGESIVEYA
ncbi:N-acetylglucosamine-6-phosphate deacetylase, partial [Burkholderia cenocepacia]